MSQIKSRKGPRALADLAAAPINAVLAKAGFAQTEVVSRWDEIVGEDLAERTAPLKIIYPRRPSGHEEPEPGTLVVRVETPYALEAQHRTDQIIARVNAFFGWRCVARVKLQQAPYLRKVVSRPKRPPADETRLHSATAAITDPGLKAALERLGRRIGGKDHN